MVEINQRAIDEIKIKPIVWIVAFELVIFFFVKKAKKEKNQKAEKKLKKIYN